MSLFFTDPVTEEEKNLIDVEDSQIYFCEEEKGKYGCVYNKGYKYLLWLYPLLRTFDKDKFEEFISYIREIDIPLSDEDNWDGKKNYKPMTPQLVLASR